ncbi:MAG TPA: hypothetical protein VN397_03825, partial [Candidatus Methylomirabilis sp.]|nr:hypothetical protein [Candidatus Methylomirabilis sp.]
MTAKQRPNLEDQLASVMEREGITALTADGVRFMGKPTDIDVTAVKRRRRRPAKAGYAGRPAVSASTHDSVLRDAVADLDRVVVGFGGPEGPRLRTVPVAIRYAEHERSPYVVSLRGLSLFNTARNADERTHVSASLTNAALPLGRVPNLESLAALAADLRVDGGEQEVFSHQFTPPTFEA